MRILMVVPKYPYPVAGGLERQAHELAKALLKRGHSLYALSSRFNNEQNDFELVDGIKIHRIEWIKSRPARFLLFPTGLMSILLKLRREIDLIHIHNISWFGAFVTMFAKILNLSVITKLPNIGEQGIPGIRHSFLGLLRIFILKKSNVIVAMTPESLTELEDIGFPREQVLKVTNGICLLTENESSRHLADAIIVVFTGRLVQQKGLIDLIHAWSIVNQRVTCPIKLRIIGDGPMEESLKSMTRTLDLGESVEFLGFCKDVPAELAKADIFVLPSYAEGNSNAILEGMRSGLPIVSTAIGGSTIQVGSEGVRFLVKTGNREALAERLCELIENRDLRQHLGAIMQARIESIFDIDRVAEIYEQAYQLILSGNSKQVGELNMNLFNQIGDAEVTSSNNGSISDIT